MADKPNKNGDIFKTEYLGTWAEYAAVEHRIVKHRDKTAPRLRFDPLVPPGKAYVLRDDHGGERVVAAVDLAVGPDKTAVMVGHVEGGKVVRDFDMECTAQELQYIRDSIAQGLGVSKELLVGTAPHPLNAYEQMMRDKMHQWQRDIYERAVACGTAVAKHLEDDMNHKNDIDITKGNKLEPKYMNKTHDGQHKELAWSSRLVCNNKITPPEPLTCFKAEVLPQQGRGNPPYDSVLCRCHTVVRVVKSRDMTEGEYLELTPMSALEMHSELPISRPVEPLPQLMERLAKAMDLPIDGYATWEGVVEFAETELTRAREANAQLLRANVELTRKLNAETRRANLASDSAGNSSHILEQERRTFALTVAEMQLELRRLRKKVGER